MRQRSEQDLGRLGDSCNVSSESRERIEEMDKS